MKEQEEIAETWDKRPWEPVGINPDESLGSPDDLGETDCLFDDNEVEEQYGVVWLEPGHCWIEHDEESWNESSLQDDSSHTVRGHGYLTDVESEEVLAVANEEEDDCPLWDTLFGGTQERLAALFECETELLKERLARRIAERDADQAYAVRASFAALEQAISRLERTLGVEAATTPTTAKAIPNLPHPVASLPIYFSERSKEWWDDLATALRAEKHKLEHEMPLLKVRVGKIAEKLTRKGLALLTKVRDLLPSLRLLDQERAAQLLEQLRESDHTEIARALHHEWLGPTKVKLLARTRRGPPLPPPRPIRELLDEALTSLEQADQSLEIEREQLATMQALRPRVEAALSHITGEAPQPSINA